MAPDTTARRISVERNLGLIHQISTHAMAAALREEEDAGTGRRLRRGAIEFERKDSDMALCCVRSVACVIVLFSNARDEYDRKSNL